MVSSLCVKKDIFVLNQSNSSWDWQDTVPQNFVNSVEGNGGFQINVYETVAGVDPKTGDFVLSSTSAKRSSSCSSTNCLCTYYRTSVAYTPDGFVNWTNGITKQIYYRNCFTISNSNHGMSMLFLMNNTLYAATVTHTTSGSSIKFYHPKNGTVIYSHQANTGVARPVRDGDSVRFYWLNNGSSSTFIHDVDLLHIHPNWTIEYHSYSKTLPADIGAPVNWDSEGFRNVVPAIYKISGYEIDFVGNYSIYTASGGGITSIRVLVHQFSQQFGSNLYVVDNDSDGHHFYDDIFPDEPSQFADLDGDGFGDNSSGFEGDACPNVAGNSTLDYYGCLDNDGDGYSYLTDSFRHRSNAVERH